MYNREGQYNSILVSFYSSGQTVSIIFYHDALFKQAIGYISSSELVFAQYGIKRSEITTVIQV